VLLFAVESVLLGIFGSIAGFFLTVLIQGLTGVLKPTWIPPSMTSRVVIQIEYLPGAMTYIFFFLLLLCLTASLVPARRAARRNIVDALGHV